MDKALWLLALQRAAAWEQQQQMQALTLELLQALPKQNDLQAVGHINKRPRRSPVAEAANARENSYPATAAKQLSLHID